MKVKALFSKIFLDKHRKFERFGVIFGSLFLVLIIITACAFVEKSKLDNQTLVDKVIYTQEFKTSLTGIDGTVSNIYRSEDKTKLFIVLNISDISKISTDASNYQMFLTGCKQSGESVTTDYLEHKAVNGSLYVFGSTGYMGIYLVDSQGFPSQIYDLVMRCNSQIVSTANTSDSKDVSRGESFEKYDQFRIYFNPGGSECDVADFLNKNDWNVVDAYEECVSRTKENELRKTLSNDVQTLKTNLSAIDEYTKRLQSLGVVIPDMSSLIAGDKVIEKDDYLIFKPNHVLATGFDFDWYNGSVKKGYLDNLCGDSTYMQYLSKKRSEVENTKFDTSDIIWTLTDGTPVDNLDSTVDTNKTINDTIGLLTGAWDTYYTNKKTYECTDLKSLLYLELDTKNIKTDCTINSDKDSALIVY